MKLTKSTWAVAGAALMLAACGGGGGGSAGTQNVNPGRGELMQNPPPRTLSLSAAEFSGELQLGGAAGQTLLGLAVAGTGSATLPCGVDVHHIKYGTSDGKGGITQASAALMVPTGGTGCSGARPIVLHAHGTAVERRFNLADFIDATNPAHDEQTLIASQYAAKGYIVVAPNYAGYDTSPLPYHPFLVADQQSKDMIDALTAARTALPKLLAPVSDNGKLFITGISQGGHVALATFQAMQALNMTVTATAPLEPVSALLNYGDYILSGHIPISSTLLMPMLINGYQKVYGDVYTSPTDFYTATYASGIEAAFPGSYSFDTLLTSVVVPPAALFSSGSAATPVSISALPLFFFGEGTGNLITDSARTNYNNNLNLTTNRLRAHLQQNDMTSLVVDKPMLMCGGSQDPTVFFSENAETSAAAWAGNPYVSLLDLENVYPLTNANAGVAKATGAAISGLQSAFQTAKAATQAAAPTDPLAVVKKYHGSLAPTFCVAAASGFFAQFP